MTNWEGLENRIDLIKKRFPSGRRKLIKIFFIIIWIAFLAAILWGAWQNHQIILPYLAGADLIYLVGVLLSYVISLISVVIVWALIMTKLKVPVNFWTNIQVYCLTLAARRLPGTIWYVGGRLIVYQRLKVSKSVVLIASILEFILILISGGITGVLFFSMAGIINSFLAIASITGIILISILIIPTLARKYNSYANGLEVIRSVSILSISGWIMGYMVTWIMGGVMIVYLVKIFQIVEWNDYLFIIGAWAISGIAGALTFFLPSSFGITEISLTALLSTIMPFPLAGVIAISARLITLTLEVLLSLIFVPFSMKLTKENPVTTEVGYHDSSVR